MKNGGQGIKTPDFSIAPGLLRPDVPEIKTKQHGGLSGTQEDARRWGMRLAVSPAYGEPWLSSSFNMAPVYSYDTWLGQIVLPMVVRYSGPDTLYVQFWNEPNNFLYPPSQKNDREHFALLTKLIWSVCKARFKEGRMIPDADTDFQMMEQTLPSVGANEYCDAMLSHYPTASAVTIRSLKLPYSPETKADTVAKLLAIRDKYYPGKPMINTEEGWWGHHVTRPGDAAAAVPRLYIPEIVAGADELYWFSQSSRDDPTHLTGAENVPWPSYCAYAAMTRLLEGKEHLGKVNVGVEGAYAYLFGRGDQLVLAVWALAGEPVVTLPLAVQKVTRNDMLDRQDELRTEADGSLKLRLSTRVQYLSFARNVWAVGVARAELKRRLELLGLTDAMEIPAEVKTAQAKALGDNGAMNRLFRLVQAARQAALAGAAPEASRNAVYAAQATHDAILNREGSDGYLRRARVAYAWTARMGRLTEHQGPALASGLSWATRLVADATAALAAEEKPAYPGVAAVAFVAPPGGAAKIRATMPVRNKRETAIDPQFQFRLPRKPGESFDLELTTWNFYSHPIEGVMTPRLPEGWTTAEGPLKFLLEPGRFVRHVFTVTIPASPARGTFSIGGTIRFGGQLLPEIHASRVVIE